MNCKHCLESDEAVHIICQGKHGALQGNTALAENARSLLKKFMQVMPTC